MWRTKHNNVSDLLFRLLTRVGCLFFKVIYMILFVELDLNYLDRPLLFIFKF